MVDKPAETELVAGRFRLESELARGGVGVVYRAHDTSTGKEVALKRLLPHAAHSPRVMALFEREYHTLVRLRHPRIVDVYDYGIDAQGPYYTMELLDGRDLGELAPIPYKEACGYLRDVASSLALLHSRNRLHRDLSPRNVRLTSDGRCKLLDFGTMANFGVAEEIVGTPPMVPPEALRGMSLDHRSDIYSLGALAYRVLSNRHAYRARQLEDLAEAWRTPPPRIETLVPGIPAELDDLVMSMLSLDPMYRPSSTSEVIDRLTAIGDLPADTDRVRAAASYLLSSRLIGRTRPMETIQRRITRAHAGSGGTVVIEGNPGVGKTRLLDEAALQAQLQGALTVRVEARSQRGPFAVAHAIARAILHAAPHDARAAAKPYAATLARVFETLADPHTRASIAPDVGVQRSQLQAAYLSWLFTLAEDHTLVLLVDDLHRVDESSAALLGALAHEARDRRVLLVATRRLAGSVSAPEAVSRIVADARRLRIHRLRRKDTLALVESLFGAVPNVGELGNFVHDVTTGTPTQILELARHLVDKNVVRFVDSMWVLPPAVPKEQLPLSLAATMSARAAALAPEERALAEALCVRRGSLSLPLCLAVAEQAAPSDVFRTMDELVAKGVLVSSGNGYHFGQEALRETLLAELPAPREKKLHERLGDALLQLGSDKPEDLIEAGFHVLRGGDERRGADLLAQAAPRLAGRGVAMSGALPALEAALELYEKQRRSPRECLRLRTIMLGSMDRRVTARYADDTLAALLYFAGAGVMMRLRPLVGATLSLAVGVLFAQVRRWLTPAARRGPRPVSAIAAFYRAGYSIMSVRTSILDLPGMDRLAAQAELFSAAGVIGKLTALVFRGTAFTVRGNPEAALALFEPALALVRQHPMLGGGADAAARRGIIAVIYISVGMLEAQYSLRSDRVLAVIDELARLADDPSLLDKGAEEIRSAGGITTPELSMASDQIRLVFHTLRGERDKAEEARGKLRVHTIQTGLELQFDIWKTLIDTAIGSRAHDVAALRRAAELLVHYVGQFPALALHLDTARACLSNALGRPKEAITTLGRWLPQLQPREISGWDVGIGCYADALMDAGDAQKARLLLAQAAQAEASRTAGELPLLPFLEATRARAEAETGDVTAALARIDRLLAALQDADHPVLVGNAHEVGARVAAIARDRGRRDAHLDLMRQWYALTRHPALLLRGQKVTEALSESDPAGMGRAPSIPPDQEAVTRITTQRQMASIDVLFEDCNDHDERCARALHLIIEQSGCTSGHLYLWHAEKLRLAASAFAGEPNDDVERLLQEQFRDFQAEDDPATPSDARSTSQIGVVSFGTEGHPEDDRYATVLLATPGRRKQLVGAVALGIGAEMPRAMRRAVLEAIARNLLDGGSKAAPQ